VCFLSVSALSQGAAQGSTSIHTSVRGIKILSSNFDSSRQSVQLDFMNDSPADITAWSYCVKAEKTNSDDPDQSFCTWTDPVPIVIDRDVQERIGALGRLAHPVLRSPSFLLGDTHFPPGFW
jgi:hypothetical protein